MSFSIKIFDYESDIIGLDLGDFYTRVVKLGFRQL